MSEKLKTHRKWIHFKNQSRDRFFPSWMLWAGAAIAELRAAEDAVTQAAAAAAEAAGVAGAVALDLEQFAELAGAFAKQHAEPGELPRTPGVGSADLPPSAAAAGAGPRWAARAATRSPTPLPPAFRRPGMRFAGGAAAFLGREPRQLPHTAVGSGGAAGFPAPPPPPPVPAGGHVGAASEPPPPPPPLPADAAAAFWAEEGRRRAAHQAGHFGSSNRRGSRGSAAWRRTSAERFAKEQWTAVAAAPYRVLSGLVARYKVHVGDLPGDWSPEDAEFHIAKILDRAECGADDYAKVGRLSDFGGRQLVCTWRSRVSAEMGQRTLHNFTYASGLRVSAKFWTPRDYDPWVEDERFAGAPRLV